MERIFQEFERVFKRKAFSQFLPEVESGVLSPEEFDSAFRAALHEHGGETSFHYGEKRRSVATRVWHIYKVEQALGKAFGIEVGEITPEMVFGPLDMGRCPPVDQPKEPPKSPDAF